MAVAVGDGDPTGDWNRDEVTTPERRPRVYAAADVGMITDDLHPPGVATPGPAPAALSGSGVFRPLPGVERGVTGMHMAMTSGTPSDEWYAAFGGRARGPFSHQELSLLAEKGRIRASTLVWKPGFNGWRRVQCENRSVDRDLRWLRSLISTRKRRERKAVEKAELRQGIQRIRLRRGEFLEPSKTPPPMPNGEMLDEDYAAAHRPPVLVVGKRMPPTLAVDRLFPDAHLPEVTVRESTLVRERRRYRAQMFTAGALLTAAGILTVGYALPALGVDTLSPLFRFLVALLPT